MRKKRNRENDELRDARLAAKARMRKDHAAAEGKSLDDAVRQSIKLHGP